MLEDFANSYARTKRVNVVNTPIELVQGRDTVPPQFLLPGILQQFPAWAQALDRRSKILSLYDQDDPVELSSLGEAKARFAGKLRSSICNVLVKQNPKTLIGEQDQPTSLNPRWRRLNGSGLIYKLRPKTAREPSLAPTLFAGTEWVVRDETMALTVAAPWQDGEQTLEAWRKRTYRNPKEWHFMAGALRDGHRLHQKGTLFMDWGLKNVVVNPATQTGRLFDYEGTISVGESPFLISEAMRERMEESPDRFKKGVQQKDDLYAAAYCIRELKQGHPSSAQVEIEKIARRTEMGQISLEEAADLLDNLAV